MPRLPDAFDVLNEEQRGALMHDMAKSVFGKTMGDKLWQTLSPAHSNKLRQLGDAKEPAENYWKGRWRIHEMP